LSIFDYAQIRRGKHEKIILQLPDSLKKRIHHSIKSYAKSAALITSTIILGFLVSIFELACTGQWYFPFIAYSVQVKREISHYLILLIYNFFFILPLAIVFILSYIGVSSEHITKIFQKNMGRTKIFFSIFFLIMAVILIIQVF
jgi:cytochrome c biogenesis protein CcdA